MAAEACVREEQSKDAVDRKEGPDATGTSAFFLLEAESHWKISNLCF